MCHVAMPVSSPTPPTHSTNVGTSQKTLLGVEAFREMPFVRGGATRFCQSSDKMGGGHPYFCKLCIDLVLCGMGGGTFFYSCPFGNITILLHGPKVKLMACLLY